MERPVLTTEERENVLFSVAKEMANCSFAQNTSDETIFEDLKDYYGSGYSDLETMVEMCDRGSGCYEPDSMMLEAIECICCEMSTARDEKIIKWVEENNIKPIFKTGESVVDKSGNSYFIKIDDEWNLKRATYCLAPKMEASAWAVLKFEEVESGDFDLKGRHY